MRWGGWVSLIGRGSGLETRMGSLCSVRVKREVEYQAIVDDVSNLLPERNVGCKDEG